MNDGIDKQDRETREEIRNGCSRMDHENHRKKQKDDLGGGERKVKGGQHSRDHDCEPWKCVCTKCAAK